jgi:hypothetical protein
VYSVRSFPDSGLPPPARSLETVDHRRRLRPHAEQDKPAPTHGGKDARPAPAALAADQAPWARACRPKQTEAGRVAGAADHGRGQAGDPAARVPIDAKRVGLGRRTRRPLALAADDRVPTAASQLGRPQPFAGTRRELRHATSRLHERAPRHGRAHARTAGTAGRRRDLGWTALPSITCGSRGWQRRSATRGLTGPSSCTARDRRALGASPRMNGRTPGTRCRSAGKTGSACR